MLYNNTVNHLKLKIYLFLINFYFEKSYNFFLTFFLIIFPDLFRNYKTLTFHENNKINSNN